MKQKVIIVLFLVLLLPSLIRAQNLPEVTMTLNEQFLNAFLEAVFTNLETPKFQLAQKNPKKQKAVNYQKTVVKKSCEESITLLRELNGTRTSIRFAEGKIFAPIAFTGNYDVPLMGCTNFRGVAQANLELQYDRQRQTLVGRVKVSKVDLNGVPGLASSLVARMVQGSIDRKINPLEILRAEQISAVVPVQYANGAIKLRAVDMKPEVSGNALNVRVAFEFAKAN